MVKIFFFSFGLMLSINACLQNKRNWGNTNYPGQLSSKDTAELFSPGLISTDSFEHSAPTFSSDGKNVLWSIVEMPSWKASILEMNYEKGQWSAPHHPAFCDSSASDIYPSFSPDNKKLYFSSNRKLPSGQLPLTGNVIWVVEKTGTGWSAPQPLDTTLPRAGSYSPSISNNGNLYFTTGPFRSPDWDIVMSNLNDSNTTALNHRLSINTTGYEDGPFIAPDESYLIFESDRAQGTSNSTDLFISFKSNEGEWTVPLNMGPRINTSASERFTRVSPDGRYLFFGSNRRQVNGKPNFDIYWIDASIITNLKEQGFK